MMFDVATIRKDFPIFDEDAHQPTLVYLDSAATSQKPKQVIERMDRFYRHENANVHRGIYALSERATFFYEEARETVKKFINAKQVQEIIFLRGTTEAINLVAQCYGRHAIKAGDEIIVTTMEHHSNIVPWQMICEQYGAILRVVPINDCGELMLDAFANLLTKKTKMVAVTHLSNALGTLNPIKKMIEMAHAIKVPVLVDGAQAVAHLSVDVQALDCDFYVFSGHKLLGPTGIGVLYGKSQWLEKMPPYHGGGEMINQVTFEKTTYKEIPQKFEAGTPHIAGAIGLGAAMDYLTSIGFHDITTYEEYLFSYAMHALADMPGFRVIGTAKEKIGIISFVMDNVHAHDVGTILSSRGVAVRSGHHCAMPVMQRFAVPATSRMSLAFYNTTADIDRFVSGLQAIREIFP